MVCSDGGCVGVGDVGVVGDSGAGLGGIGCNMDVGTVGMLDASWNSNQQALHTRTGLMMFKLGIDASLLLHFWQKTRPQLRQW